MQRAAVYHSDPEILGGTPVFVGTRVPVQTLVDYLAARDEIEEFLDDFPTVSRDQAEAFIEQMDATPLSGSVRRYEGPDEPATSPDDWEAL